MEAQLPGGEEEELPPLADVAPLLLSCAFAFFHLLPRCAIRAVTVTHAVTVTRTVMLFMARGTSCSDVSSKMRLMNVCASAECLMHNGDGLNTSCGEHWQNSLEKLTA